MSKLKMEQQTIFALFTEKRADFLIPDYQRPYAWEDAECQTLWEDIFKKVLVREVEIISITRQGGSRSAVWKVDFKTYDLYNEIGQSQGKQESTLRVRYWTASVTAYFIPERAFIVPRLINPMGFTVTRYSQTEVEVL